jgi:hypothetical protein
LKSSVNIRVLISTFEVMLEAAIGISIGAALKQ